jgi:hypothetical protein
VSPRPRPLRSLVPACVPVLLLGGAACGIVLTDISQRDLVVEPAERMTVLSEGGAVEVYAFDRNGINLFYYMKGSLEDIGDVGYRFSEDGETLEVQSMCDSDDFCEVSWYIEIPTNTGTSVEVETHHGGAKLTGIIGDVVADVSGGGFEGVALRSDVVDVVIEAGDAVVELLEPPTSVILDVGEGNVELTLPPGSHRCELTTGDGEIDTTNVACDPMATALVQVTVDVGDITLLQGAAP